MPYTSIHWIKLEKRLLNDHRFFLMSEKAQLFYVKLLLLCATCNNKVPRDYRILSQLLRVNGISEKELTTAFDEIRASFPKVLIHKDYYYIKDFKNRHNWVAPQELPENSEGSAKDSLSKVKKRIDIDKIRYITDSYISLKKFPTLLENGQKDQTLITAIYKRNGRVVKELLAVAKDDEKLVEEAMLWLAEALEKKDLNWTLETVLKWFPEFLVKGKKSEALKRLEQLLKET